MDGESSHIITKDNMTHRKEEREMAGHRCTLYLQDNPEYLLLQPADANDRKEMDTEVEAIRKATDARFVLVAIHIDRWFDELPPWPAPPVFGKRPFGDGAAQTLEDIQLIISELKRTKTVPETGVRVLLGGYSLAGLFALWAGYQHPFDGIVAASPSIWYQGWTAYAEQHPPRAAAFYLSLGDREDHSRTKIMTTVSRCIRRQHELLEAAGVRTVLEWNEGNHFQDNGLRTAKGFAWLMAQGQELGRAALPYQE